MAEIKWIKISTGLFDDEAIQVILDFPDGAVMLEIWLRLLIAAGKCNDQGIVYFKENIPYNVDLLATVFNKKNKQIELALQTFSKFNMIKILDNQQILIQNWEKYQSIEKLDKIRESTRNRVKRFRENQKAKIDLLESNAESNVTYNVTVTQSNAVDIDKDIDIDNKKDKSFLLEENQKNEKQKIEDPYFSTKGIVATFKNEYKKLFGSDPYLSQFNINKILELSSEVQNFAQTIPTVLEKLKNLDFDLPNFKPNHMWLLSNDNYMKVYSGMYDKKDTSDGTRNSDNRSDNDKYSREKGWF